ncbi:semaphorin-2A-like, partial [Fopius arisanus]|uniref:Semaphorin-2A-like n=1 Tax=Fopius arisanus TaxID=64838 RepID=A0A9R1TLZ4_9HYME
MMPLHVDQMDTKERTSWVFWMCVLLVVVGGVKAAGTLEKLHEEHVREFSCGMLYYRTLYLDSKRDSLYVGAMDKVFRLNLSNISHTSCE